MATLKVYRPKAVADPPRPSLDLLAFAGKVEQKLANSIYFKNIGAVLTNLSAARLAYEEALQNKGKQKQVTDACTAARQALLNALTHAKDFVNSVAETASPDDAKAIIESSGFRSKKVVLRAKLPLAVKDGPASGIVILEALAAGRSAMYYFQISMDQKTWTALPSVMKCKTTVTGLIPGTTYAFRVQVQTPKGLGDWSMPVTFIAR